MTIRPPSRSRFAASRSVLMLPFEVDRDLAVDQHVVALGDARQLHDAGIVDQHVDPAERRLRRVEHAGDRRRVADIRLGRDGAAAGRLDLAHQCLGFRRAARIIDDDGEAIRRQPLGDRGTDAPRGAGDDRYLVRISVHCLSPVAVPPVLSG